MPTPTGRLHLLLVEDDQAFADAFLERLATAQPGCWDMVHVTSLDAAQVALQTTASPFDLLILDLALPDSVGLLTLKRMVDMAAGVPIVVLSGGILPETEEETTVPGAVAFAHKNVLINDYPSFLQLLHVTLQRQARNDRVLAP